MKKEKIAKEIRILSLIIFLVIFMFGIYAAYNYDHTEEYFSLFIEQYGLISLFIII